MLLYWAFRAASALARLAPVRLSYALARMTGTLAYYAWPGGRRRCVDNMRRPARGDERLARRYARRSFANYAVYLVDFLRFMGTSPEELNARVHFHEWDRVEEQRRGNGIVFVTMHFGNWDLGAAALAMYGVPVAAVADTFPNQRVNDLVLSSREHLGMTIIPADRMGPGILRALRRNDVVATLIDIPFSSGGVEVEFFGGTIAVSEGPARIALRAGSSVIVATLPRLGPWSETVGADISPVAYEPTGDNEHDVKALTQAVFSHLEQLVLRHPDQWYIFRHLWPADAAAANSA
ncbi:MAG: hypothetical protein GEU80_10710 [Dehalococcoidia bacterium]|nr:hypothetical protein [Dehalococcoidia bacterium]